MNHRTNAVTPNQSALNSILICIALLSILPSDLLGQSHDQQPPQSTVSQPVASAKHRTIAAARQQAILLHHAYVAAQDVMHRRYFHGGKAAVPARAMEDVFAEMKAATNTEAKWISVSFEPMSIDHEPKTEFEKRAARELKSGKSDYETVGPGIYRRASAVSLSGGCVSCHSGLVSRPPSRPIAGLVIGIPIGNDAVAEKTTDGE